MRWLVSIARRSRSPQYSRIGYGFKIGLGNSSRFLDLIYFHAKDNSGSASIVTPVTKNFIHAQENAVLGTSFKLTMIKKLIWTGDIAISGLVPDLSSNNKIVDSSNKGLRKLRSVLLHKLNLLMVRILFKLKLSQKFLALR